MSIRKIKFREFLLTGLTTPLFPYEILLPDHYCMIYTGLEEYGANLIDQDFNYLLIDDKDTTVRFRGKIIVINLNRSGNLKYINPNLDIEKCNPSIMLDVYKTLVASSTLMIIYIEDNKIRNISVDYLINPDEAKSIWLISDKYPTKDFLLMERY